MKDEDEDEENIICSIKFQDEGLKFHWKTLDIVKHLYEIKHYKKGKKCSANILQLREVEENIELGEEVIGGKEMEANGKKANLQVQVGNAPIQGSHARRPPKRF